MEAESLWIVLPIVTGYLWFSHWTAIRAQRKGKSYNVFLVFALCVSPLLVLVLIEVMADTAAMPGDIIRTLRNIKLEDGTVLPKSFTSEVLDTDVINLTHVVQIDGPERSLWTARDQVYKV